MNTVTSSIPARSAPGDPERAPISCVLVAAGQFHDIDFARLELLKLLAEDERIRVRVFEDFENRRAIDEADVIISYTCNLVPSPEAQKQLKAFVSNGGRYFALHGTNAVLTFLEDGRVDVPDAMPTHSEMLGSRFVAHPPITEYTVRNVQPQHPLTRGLPKSFVTRDEQYLLEPCAELEVLLDTEYNGVDSLEGFVHDTLPRARHPVFYIRRLGAGAVLYLTLGHCRGHYDMRPLLDWWPEVDRCGWDQPLIYELLRRGIRWTCARTQQEAAAH
ncbi:MAG: ThuA domain-containing protein [Pseudomonadota bacterium]